MRSRHVLRYPIGYRRAQRKARKKEAQKMSDDLSGAALDLYGEPTIYENNEE